MNVYSFRAQGASCSCSAAGAGKEMGLSVRLIGGPFALALEGGTLVYE
jgi:hypothetical protein